MDQFKKQLRRNTADYPDHASGKDFAHYGNNRVVQKQDESALQYVGLIDGKYKTARTFDGQVVCKSNADCDAEKKETCAEFEIGGAKRGTKFCIPADQCDAVVLHRGQEADGQTDGAAVAKVVCGALRAGLATLAAFMTLALVSN